MADKKIIAIMGATGMQGGGLARAILRDRNSKFAVRAITRDVNSAKARELAKLGAELVTADIDDLESLKRAFSGAYGAYCVTFYWAHMSPDRSGPRPPTWLARQRPPEWVMWYGPPWKIHGISWRSAIRACRP